MSNNVKETRGRCRGCSTIYQWIGKPNLHDAACPGCGQKLERCRTLDPERRLFQQPAVVPP